MTTEVQPTAPWADCRACDGTGTVSFPGPADTVVPVPCKCPRRPKLVRCTCDECGEKFEAKRRAHFCSAACKNGFHNRSAKRGKVTMPVLLAWRASKSKRQDPTGRAAFAELCRLADAFNAEDRAAGRKPVYDIYARQLRTYARDH